MQTTFLNKGGTLFTGVILLLPATYLMLISILKYAFGWSWLFDQSQPVLESMGIKESPGFNITSLIIIGPLVALAINLLVISRMKFKADENNITLSMNIQRSPQNIAVVIMSLIILTALFLYGIGENCKS